MNRLEALYSCSFRVDGQVPKRLSMDPHMKFMCGFSAIYPYTTVTPVEADLKFNSFICVLESDGVMYLRGRVQRQNQRGTQTIRYSHCLLRTQTPSTNFCEGKRVSTNPRAITRSVPRTPQIIYEPRRVSTNPKNSTKLCERQSIYFYLVHTPFFLP